MLSIKKVKRPWSKCVVNLVYFPVEKNMSLWNACHRKNTEFDLHYGKIGSIPNSTAGMMRLSVAYLRAILRKHQILDLGTKEELITRVQLLKAGYLEAAFSREHLCIKLHMIEVAMTIRSTQEELSSKSFRRKRKYANGKENTVTTRTSCLKDIISPKEAVLNIENQQWSVDKALEALKLFVGNVEEKLQQKTDDLEKKAVKLSNKKRGATQESSKCEKVMKMEPVKNVIQCPGRKKLLAKLRESGEAQSTQSFAVGQSVEVFGMRRIWKGPTGNLAGIKKRFNTFMRRMVLFILFILKIEQSTACMQLGLLWMGSFIQFEQ